jgi:(1->4)-alpha-D-glucan 1-alpha-D-glucosylmutase
MSFQIPEEWRHAVFRWSRINKKKSVIEGQWVPARDEEYLLYQTLIGIGRFTQWRGSYELFKKRIKDYMSRQSGKQSQHELDQPQSRL